MAHHKSTQKSIRKNARVSTANNIRRTRTRSFVKNVEKAIEAGNLEEARNAVKLAQRELDTSVGKGIFKLNTASRKISRLNKRIKDLSAGGSASTKAKPASTVAKKKAAATKKKAAATKAKPAAKKKAE